MYPLPRIQDILKRRPGYAFITKLDVSMQCYTFELDNESEDLCVISTPFGLFHCCRLPMGVKQSSDIAQEAMETILRELDEVEVYIDDVGCVSSTFGTHLQTLNKVLTKLEDNCFTIIRLNANGLSRRLTGWDIGLLPLALNLGPKRCRPF